MNKAEEKVSKFYNTVGWETNEEITEDAKRFEDLRENSKDYISKCRLRLLKYIPDKGDKILDMASGPIQYKEYLEYSKNFNKRYCVDLSSTALDMAKNKIGEHGIFLHGSFFDLNFEENFFDCSISLHTIYHMDKDKQEEAVRKLIRVTKPGKNVVIIYENPNTIMRSYRRSLFYRLITLPFRIFKKIFKPIRNEEKESNEKVGLYFYTHPNSWWSRFDDIADVNIYPWRSFGVFDQKKIIPNNFLGRILLKILFHVEERYPNFFSKHFEYPLIVLTKKIHKKF